MKKRVKILIIGLVIFLLVLILFPMCTFAINLDFVNNEGSVFQIQGVSDDHFYKLAWDILNEKNLDNWTVRKRNIYDIT